MKYELRQGTTDGRNTNEVFGEDVASERTACRWFQKFRSGGLNLEIGPHGRPAPKVDNYELKAIVDVDTSQTKRDLAARFKVSIFTIHDHSKQIDKVNKLEHWVPHGLSEQQKWSGFDVCLSLLSRQKSEPFLHHIVTYDEKQIIYDNRKHLALWLDKVRNKVRNPSSTKKFDGVCLVVYLWNHPHHLHDLVKR